MATALTEAQREAKRKRDADYRARKKAGIAGVVAEKLEAIEVVDAEEAVNEAQLNAQRLDELTYKVADTSSFERFVPANVPENQRVLFVKTLEADVAATSYAQGDNQSLDEFIAGRAAVINAKRIALRAKKGDVVVFPGNAPAEGQVAYVHRDTGRLITADGFSKSSGWCEHAGTTDLVYYEYVGGAWAGEHGWVHGDLKCRRIAQTG